MFSHPSPESVVSDLGDKVVSGLIKAVFNASEDLEEYRKWRPSWVATHTERCLANWIHDRLWFHIMAEIEDLHEVGVLDQEPHREVSVGTKYRMRIKRHDEVGQVRYYQTALALEFASQGVATLPGLEETKLFAGYVWDSENRKIGGAVISLPDGRRDPHWVHELQDPQTGTNVSNFPIDTVPGPSAPTIEVGSEAASPERGQEAGPR